MELAEISRRTLYHWRQKDPEFDSIERKTLPELRKTFTQEIVFWEYIRNLRMTMAVDERLLEKAVLTPEDLTRQDWVQLKSMRKMYSENGLTDLRVATN